MKTSPILIALLLIGTVATQAQGYKPIIEATPSRVKIAPGLLARSGYLVVPENRQKPKGRTIKIPFLFVRQPQQDSVKNISLFTTGGPGYSTIANFDSIRYNSDWFKFGGVIFFDQRGTQLAQPCLDCPEVPAAHQRAYRENLAADSLEALAVTQCRKRLSAQGIDLSAYTTIESAADINDLRKALGLDSLTLSGISYSCGLMLTVARNHPEAVRMLLLNSPLPGYVNYEEHALFNFNEGINQVFTNTETDSTHDNRYANLRQRFQQYFTGITGKRYAIRYAPAGAADSFTTYYTKAELIDAITDRINNWQLKTVPAAMVDIINGHHTTYVREQLDNVFNSNNNLSEGMRYSIYCSEQIAYASQQLIELQSSILPWFAGVPFNNVDHRICDCWKVKPEPPVAKTPVYSNVPALIVAGDADPWCRPFYNRTIQRTMPYAQVMIVHNNTHGARYFVNGVDFLEMFIKAPYSKLKSAIKEVTIE
ncbi:alpha/beta hydrolase [Paraflavitalea sp. CAU 1676]|uniref:alpha/beta hydrolase n=1 Tax=Paraflavitalea sp. CAU 1676 TaxID=3032598 RepID=UPI0023DB0CDE|nr:alpha/beta hydrolase [Paraflavitalea sp. CAU 1676]MDF2190593.1 alpha/beta hydrolase [Paraflavitalea sp. CAU 1676]